MKKCLLAVVLSVCCVSALHAAEGGLRPCIVSVSGESIEQVAGKIGAHAERLLALANKKVGEATDSAALEAMTNFIMVCPEQRDRFIEIEDEGEARRLQEDLKGILSEAAQKIVDPYAEKLPKIYNACSMRLFEDSKALGRELAANVVSWGMLFLRAQREVYKKRRAEGEE